MTDFELLSILLMVFTLILAAYEAGQKSQK